MAGHAHGRGQTYSHSQPNHSHPHPHPHPHSTSQSQPQQRPDSSTHSQDATAATSTDASDPTSPSNPQKPKLRTSCDGCQEAKLGCSQEKPTCRRCMRHGIACVYSPFRRIGRPRKSTNSRSTNATNPTKPRSKKSNASDNVSRNDNEILPTIETDSMFVDPILAPPSSPASTENGTEHRGGPWYPWSADGNSLYSAFPMNMENHTSMMDGTDPYSSTSDYLDLDAYFDNHHNVLMDCSMSGSNDPMQSLAQPMQPTPPSSIDLEMMTSREPFNKTSDKSGFGPLLSQHTQQHPRDGPASTLTSNIPGLALGSAYTDFAALHTSQSTGTISHPPLQLSTPGHPNGHAFAPSPELTPPLSAQSPPSQNPCSKRCSSSLIRQLAVLNQHLSEECSIDVVLQVEKDAHSLCRNILNCGPCIDNKSSYLLFSMVVEQVMRLLEMIPDEGASESCTLLVGTFEVDKDTKSTFLKRYLISRLHKFANMLKDFAKTIDRDANDYNSNAAKEMVNDVYQRLELLTRVISLWE